MLRIITATEAQELAGVLDECFELAKESDNHPMMVKIGLMLMLVERLREVDAEEIIK